MSKPARQLRPVSAAPPRDRDRAPSALNADTAEEIAGIFHLLGEPNRLRLVAACLESACTVNDLAALTGISPSLASHHLRLLKAARLVRPQRRGKFVHYTAHDDHVRDIIGAMIDHVSEPEGED